MDRKTVEQVVIALLIAGFAGAWGWKNLTGTAGVGGFACSSFTTAFQDVTVLPVHNYEGPVQLINTCNQDIVLRDDDNSQEMIIPTDIKAIGWPITASDGTLTVNLSGKHNGAAPTAGTLQIHQLR